MIGGSHIHHVGKFLLVLEIDSDLGSEIWGRKRKKKRKTKEKEKEIS